MNKTIRCITPEILEINWPAAVSEEILFDMLKIKTLVQQNLGVRLKAVRMGYHVLSLQVVSVDACIREVEESLSASETVEVTLSTKRWKFPVCYDAELAKDLISYLHRKDLDLEEFVSLHSGVEYLLYFYGFLPGFMYLGGLPTELALPRKQFPDRHIEKGSVAIGGAQTGVYPMDSPGGWHVVGKTPLSLLDASKGKLPPFSPGDRIRFIPIRRSVFEQIARGSLIWEYV